MNKCEYCARFSFFMTDPNDMFHGGCHGEGEGVNRHEDSPCGLKLFRDRKEWRLNNGIMERRIIAREARPDLVIVDDPCDLESAREEAK